jgi:hypothetical protein
LKSFSLEIDFLLPKRGPFQPGEGEQFENVVSWKLKTISKWIGKYVMHWLYFSNYGGQGHLSSHKAALGLACWISWGPGVTRIQNSFYGYSQTIKHTKAQEKQELKSQAFKQHYNSYMHSVDSRRLLSL